MTNLPCVGMSFILSAEIGFPWISEFLNAVIFHQEVPMSHILVVIPRSVVEDPTMEVKLEIFLASARTSSKVYDDKILSISGAWLFDLKNGLAPLSHLIVDLEGSGLPYSAKMFESDPVDIGLK